MTRLFNIVKGHVTHNLDHKINIYLNGIVKGHVTHNLLMFGHPPQVASVYVMSLSMEEEYICKLKLKVP